MSPFVPCLKKLSPSPKTIEVVWKPPPVPFPCYRGGDREGDPFIQCPLPSSLFQRTHYLKVKTRSFYNQHFFYFCQSYIEMQLIYLLAKMKKGWLGEQVLCGNYICVTNLAFYLFFRRSRKEQNVFFWKRHWDARNVALLRPNKRYKQKKVCT